MIVAVVAVGVMEVAVDQAINVVAVGDGGMAVVGAVLVCFVVAGAGVLGSAVGEVGFVDGEGVFLDFAAFDVVQVAVVQVIDVAVLDDTCVATTWAVLVGASLVMLRYDYCPSGDLCAGFTSNPRACASAFCIRSATCPHRSDVVRGGDIRGTTHAIVPMVWWKRAGREVVELRVILIHLTPASFAAFGSIFFKASAACSLTSGSSSF